MQDSLAAVMKDKAEKAQKENQKVVKQALDSAALNDSTALFHQALSGTDQQIVLKNQKLELTFNTKGGTVSKAVIKDFKSIDNTNNVTLFDKEDQRLNFMLTGKQDNIVTQDLYFTPLLHPFRADRLDSDYDGPGTERRTGHHTLSSGAGLPALHVATGSWTGQCLCTIL